MATLVAIVPLAITACTSIASESASTTSTAPTTTRPPSSTTNARVALSEVLQQLSVQPGDLAAGYEARLEPGGVQGGDEPTLDLCGATFATEEFRTARRQVIVTRDDAPGSDPPVAFVVDAVAYDTPERAAQAIDEVRRAQQDCPKEFVKRANTDEPEAKYTFYPAPDTNWPVVPGVARYAIDFSGTTKAGGTTRGTVIFSQRGRYLVVFYLRDRNAFAAATSADVAGIRGYSDRIAQRLLAAPAAS